MEIKIEIKDEQAVETGIFGAGLIIYMFYYWLQQELLFMISTVHNFFFILL